MQDMLLKYGMLLIALVLALMMAFFAFNALKQTEPALDSNQQISGDSAAVYSKIFSLCKVCAKDANQQKDCFILKTSLTEAFQPASIDPSILPAGNWQTPQAFKIENKKGTCVVTGFG